MLYKVKGTALNEKWTFIEPVRLPDIPVKVKKPSKTTWTIAEQEEEELKKSPTVNPDDALKKLRQRKAQRKSEYRYG